MSCQFYVSSVGEAFIFLRDVCKLQSVVNFEYDFSLVPDAAGVQYNFKTKKTLSCQFYVSSVSETFSFLRDVCKLQSVVNFDYHFSMVPIAVEVGKLEIINVNLNKLFISLRKVITEHWHRTPRENLKA